MSDENIKAVERYRRERWTQIVGRENRQKILDGEHPRLEWKADACPVEPGDEIPVHPDVDLRIMQVKAVKGRSEAVEVRYVIRDLRPERLLRRGVPAAPDRREDLVDDQVPPPDAEGIERAREQGNYTRHPHLAVPGEPEGVLSHWEDVGVAEREAKRQEARQEIQAEEEARRAEDEARAWLMGVIRQVPPEHRLEFVKRLRASGGDLADQYLRNAA